MAVKYRALAVWVMALFNLVRMCYYSGGGSLVLDKAEHVHLRKRMVIQEQDIKRAIKLMRMKRNLTEHGSGN